MIELAMLAEIQRTVYPTEVTHQLHVMAQARESWPAKDQRSTHCATPPTKHYSLMLMSLLYLYTYFNFALN